MKRLIKIFSMFLLAIMPSNITTAQIPTYNLRAMNFTFYGCPHRTVEFDICMEHTNSPVPFEYSAGQYFFNFNPLIANGGTLTYSITGSDLRSDLLPRNPTISGSQLRLATNLPPGPGNGYIMTNNGYPGTKIVRMRLITSAGQMSGLPSLVWRSALPNPFTKIFAFEGINIVEITSPATHSVTEIYSPYCETFLLNSPEFNSAGVNIPVSLSWYKAVSADFYKVEVSDFRNFSNIVFADSSVTDTFRAATNLNLNTTYFWKVSANDGNSYYVTSDVWTFRTGNNPGGIAPTYNLIAKNFRLNSPQNNQLEFDIYIQHTNPPVMFEYALGQYNLKFNPNIANGGTLTYSLIESDLPPNLRPTSPSIRNASNPNETVMALVSNTPPPPGYGYIMTDNGLPGTKIARMRLETSATSLAIENPEISWRNPPIVSFSTKIFAFVGTTIVDITTPVTHSVQFDIHPLPVELASFTSSLNRNEVILSWMTVREVNNRGFEIERSGLGLNMWDTYGSVSGFGNTEETQYYSFTDKNVQPGKYNYRLKQLDYNGNIHYHDLPVDIEIGIPEKFNVSQNYPNPFNPSTKIDFDLPDNGNVSICVYDITGREVNRILNEERKAGYYSTVFDAANLASGAYFYRVFFATANRNYVLTKRMMIIK